MTYNVALIVLDTLREDYAQGLEALKERGFIKYKNAIAPAPWTLPSHVSMLTGLYPSEHGIFHTENTVYKGPQELARISRLRMYKLGHGIIGEFTRYGYNTYIITANPIITPYFGFKADHVKFAHPGGVTSWTRVEPQEGRLIKFFKLAIEGNFFQMFITTSRYLKYIADVRRKGGTYIYNYLLKNRPQEPYFLLVNIMEAHPPYTRNDLIGGLRDYIRCFFETIAYEKCTAKCHYTATKYPAHSTYATSLAMRIIDILDSENTLTVVVADHGEALCDPGFGHGYWLLPSVVRVSLWVKYPRTINPLPQKGRYVSLTHLPVLLRVVFGERHSLGEDTVKSESHDLPYAIDVFKDLENIELIRKVLGKALTFRSISFYS